MPSPLLLKIEAGIAASHRHLNWARLEAQTMSDLGLADDIEQVMKELERIQISLLKQGGSLRSRIHR